ncbi:MAG: choice-of-anchor J domain-containing protein [Anaerolineae bacterium]
MSKTGWRWLSLAIVTTLLVAFAPGSISAQEPAEKIDPASLPATIRAPQGQPPLQISAPTEQVLNKLYPSLRELVSQGVVTLPTEAGPIEGAARNEPILVHIIATPVEERAADGTTVKLVDRLKPYFVDGKLYAQPMGVQGKPGPMLQILFGRILPSNLIKVASHPAVQSILPITIERNEYEVYPADEPRPEYKPGPDDWAKLRENAAKLREGSLPWSQARAFGDGRERPPTEDWFEVMPEGPHKAKAAWERGYKGQGVTIAVIDDGVDMAHPDMMGTQKIYNSSAAPQYNGWPMVMDPFSMRAYFYDLLFGTTFVSGSFGGVTYIDTSTTPALRPAGPGISTFKYTPMIDYNVPGLEHTYVISDSMSKSGVVHVGTHVDESLRDYVWGEKVAVLVADPNVAGVYDTVYVDLDDDYDFRDEKPLTKANPADPSTYNNMVAYRDMNADGLADLSGGLLYWIADGANWVPAMDWLFFPAAFGLTPPGPGDLIAMHGPWDSGYSHGTQCASNAVAQGVINGMLPEFRDLPPGPGTPQAAVYGAAPEADLVPMNSAWSFVGRITYNDAYMLAAVGWDGVDQTGWHWFYGPGYSDTDGIQITSNSYGFSADDNDGWDFLGQYIWQIQRYFAPYLQFLFSTGNGAPGYGTSAPPSPGLGVMVGSTTEYGSTGWDTITDTTQINFNDYTAFSNGGPGARSGAGVDVLGVGSFAAGAEELNYYAISTWGVLDGNISWATWGGTSRSSPTVMGNLALVYQAYKAKHGTWPTADQARALLMSSATDIKNNVLKQGAGSVNADRGTLVAGGHYGVYMAGDSATWEPGDYDGTYYPGFAQVVEPGDAWSKVFTVVNDGPTDITVEVSDKALELIESEEFEFTVTPEMVAGESVYGAANRDNFYKAFQFFIPITAAADMDPSWYHIAIPDDTELMVVRQIFPYGEFDPNGDYTWDQRYYLMVYNWTDENGDGNVWEDKNSNGVVNFINGTEWTSVDVGPELAWDDPRTELDRWEYERFGYNRPYANLNELTVRDPLQRMGDGLFIGLRHLYTGAAASLGAHLKYRIEFYKKADVDWLSTSTDTLVVPAGNTAIFTGTINVPADMPPGVYEAAIEVYDPGNASYDEHTTIIPVVMNVAAGFSGGALTLGGWDSYLYDQDRPYNNAAVRSYFDWGWREESGDWRFFYVDVDNEPVATPLFTENFDSATPPALPTGWDKVDVSGTAGDWTTRAGTWHPSGYPAHSAPNLAVFNSWTASSGNSTRLYTTSGVDLSTANTPVLTFWMFHDGQYSNNDVIQPQVSTDGGGTWTNVGPAFPRYVPGTYAWQQHTVDLSAYVGQADVRIGFLAISAYGNDCHIDDVAVVDYLYPIPPDSQVLVRDVWDDVAPHTDIDTVILGPTPTGLSETEFGVWAGDFSEPSFFGPYVLDTVAKSVVDRIGRSTWRFNTTSGGAEEWVSFPISSDADPDGGLHEILQHNVLFEGDAFHTVFTKTLGTLMEDKHSFELTTYVNQGLVGDVTLEASLPLSGLTASGYLIDIDDQFWTDEPLPFTGPGTIEWYTIFALEDAISIELWTSSADVPDLDLYLFYWTGTAWQQRASSAGVDANEHILLANPPDGQWLIGIDNYSGPAGAFNLIKEVKSRIPGLIIEGVPSGEVPADTPVKLTIRYDYPMIPGRTYGGMVVVGPPEAPQIKQIPITIHRMAESAGLTKEVDEPLTFAGKPLNYTVQLYNLSDPGADFFFTDPIPEETEFVSVQSRFTPCPVPPATGATLLTENFDGATPPALPAGWAQVDVSGTDGNWATNAGTVHPSGQPAHSAPNLAYFNSYTASSGNSTRLYYTAGLDLSGVAGAQVRFWMYHDPGYSSSNDRVQVQLSTDGGLTWTDVGTPVSRYRASAGWLEHAVDLSAYAGQADVRIGFLGISAYGNDCHIDDVQVEEVYCPVPEPAYEAANDRVVYHGPIAMNMAGGAEGFEAGVMPPAGWMTEHRGATSRVWTLVNAATYPDFVHSGNWAAWVNYDSDYSSDEWLYTVPFKPTAADHQASFWAFSDTLFPGATMKVWAVKEDSSMDLLWDLIQDEVWTDAVYRLVTLDLSAYVDQEIRLAWQYVGLDGESFGLDDVYVPQSALPGLTIEIGVKVTDSVAAGTWITNTGTVTATHALPEGEQAEPPVSASAASQVSPGPDLAGSYKVAPETIVMGTASIEYEVHVINSGTQLALVTFTDPIPAGTTYAWHNTSPPYQHFTFNSVENRVEWTGNIAPGEEWVFSFGVDVDPAVMFDTVITNTASLEWATGSMDLVATTLVLAPYQYYLPIVAKGYAP